ncbi:MAG: hypothetical protein R3246_10745 [Acidimicrobiia bacterium]|nr:hypothetical protein [Acidimicrobiia bacterium]
MRLFGSSATTSKSTRRHARLQRPVTAFDAPRTAPRRHADSVADRKPVTVKVPTLVPRSA